jgi:hypothetical protein
LSDHHWTKIAPVMFPPPYDPATPWTVQ